MKLTLIALTLTLSAVAALLYHRSCRRHTPCQQDMPWLAAVRHIVDIPGRGVDLPVQIMPHLLLGDKRSAGDLHALDALGVTHILNVAGTYGRSSLPGTFHYLEIHAEDEEGYPIIERHLKEASAFIRKARDEGGRCLIHCQAGINRSGCLAVAELMLTERLPVVQAVERGKQARRTILSNHSFQ